MLRSGNLTLKSGFVKGSEPAWSLKVGPGDVVSTIVKERSRQAWTKLVPLTERDTSETEEFVSISVTLFGA